MASISNLWSGVGGRSPSEPRALGRFGRVRMGQGGRVAAGLSDGCCRGGWGAATCLAGGTVGGESGRGCRSSASPRVGDWVFRLAVPVHPPECGCSCLFRQV